MTRDDHDDRRARDALLARYADPTTPPFDGAVALTCCECGVHLTWTNPPPPPVPTACARHAAPGRLTMDGPAPPRERPTP